MKKMIITGAAGVILVVLLSIYAESCHEHSPCENCDLNIRESTWNG